MLFKEIPSPLSFRMFLFSVLLIAKAIEKTQNLLPEIGEINHCAAEDEIYHVITPSGKRFLFAITEISEGIEVTYSYPVGNDKNKVNGKDFVAIFPSQKAEITFNIPKDKCVSYAFTDIINQACLTSMHVIVNSSKNYQLNATENYGDYCVFFASPSTSMSFDAKGNVGENTLSVYKEKFDLNPDNVYQNNIDIGKSSGRSTPIVMRFVTGEIVENAKIDINFYSSSPRNNIAAFDGEPTKIKNKPSGIFDYSELFPFIGSFPFVVMVLFLLLSFINVYRKTSKSS